MPTLRVITSSSQERLVERLADNLRLSQPSPLEEECIVTLSNGMSRWVSMELASRLGVSAGVRFIFPNDLLDNCFRSILSYKGSSLPYTCSSMTWRIASKLPALSHLKGFEQVAAYLGDGRDDRRLLQISASLADCFDQYTIFRPEMILAWDDANNEHWQAQLWRAITNDCRDGHRAALLKALHNHVASGARPGDTLPRRITLFGISYLPNFHLQALSLLSNYCDVTCYLLNPCGEYWGTIIPEKMRARLSLKSTFTEEAEEYYETGNTLLSSLGTLGQDFFEALLEYGFETEELDTTWNAEDQNRLANPPSLLSTIQNDILTLFDRPASDTKNAISADDPSLQIHSCHGALREMEILYDNLLALFDKLPNLEPRHIVVMIPDIESYAPYISSVFSNRSDRRPPLPYCIADRSLHRENLFVDAFLKILDATFSRFTLDDMIDLLEMPAVMDRFEIDADELVRLRVWLRDCNVRWGFDADHRVDLGFPPYSDFSWQAGLDRLFLGYAMLPDGDATFNGILPYSACFGSPAETVGKLARFLEVLRGNSHRLNRPHTLQEWADILSATVVDMLLPKESDSAGAVAIAKGLNSLREAGSIDGFTEPIAFNAVRDHLTDSLAKGGSGYGFMGGQITFCAMLPMRSIPMRIVWLAGMNDGAFPRIESPPGFNLMNGSRRRGDRSLRDEDRYMFLEALMSAKDCFCISYNGQNDRDNSTLSPSVLITELVDYITAGFVNPDGTKPQSFIIHHPLQEFSPRYFDGHDPAHLFSYDLENCQAVEKRRIFGLLNREFITEPLLLDSETLMEIELQHLVRFLANPAAVFLGQCLGIRPFNPAEAADDAEPFAINPLSRYNLLEELTVQLQKGADYDDCLTAARSRGVLPPLSGGTTAFNAAWEKSRQFAADIQTHLGSTLEPLAISFTHDNVQLNATLANCRSGIHTRWRPASMKAKDRLSIWLDHLLLNIAKADGYPLQSMMITTDRTLELMPVEGAKDILTDLLQIYREGMQHPLRFFPETSWALLNEGQARAETYWRGDKQRGFSGERDNQAVALCFGDAEPWGEEMFRLAERIYAPLIAATE